MPRKLEFREGLTAVVGWDKGLVAEPTATERAAGVPADQLAAGAADSGADRMLLSGAGGAGIRDGFR